MSVPRRLSTEHYKDNPKDFVNRLYAMKLNEKLNLQIKGEGTPLIRYPGDKLWSGLITADDVPRI